MKSIKFSVNVYNAGSENEKITVSSSSSILLSAKRTPAPMKEEPKTLEKEIFELAKICDKVTLEKDKNKKLSESELCDAIFDDYTLVMAFCHILLKMYFDLLLIILHNL